jgi:GTP-binding protein LepA
MSDLSLVRNFCIIAHIDHGKSTLADRMLDVTETIEARERKEQILDSMDLERERGITIKAHPVTMRYKASDGKTYRFNLIDTPGHVDFSYEVSRSLAACEGALLVVDAAQGVEAQTVANTHLAMEQGLAIIPVLNKIDLPSANVAEVTRQIEDILMIELDQLLAVSAKTGQGVGEVMESIVQVIPPPKGDVQAPARALVFDSTYDPYRGVITYIRLFDGALGQGTKIRLMSTRKDYEVKETGIFTPKPLAMPDLVAGDVGYLVGNIKDTAEIKIGDTITRTDRPSQEPLPGFQQIQPMVFSGIYPVNTADYEKLKHSLDKLILNDSSFHYQAESSAALGLGFRCGFLGLLHMEIIQERLRREYDMDIITTYPGVVYQVHLSNGEMVEIDNPVHLPDITEIKYIEEPLVNAFIISPNEYIGEIMQLVMDKRGEVEKTETIDARRVMLTCNIPLNEILIDFHDRLKSISRGYASMDYEHIGYFESDLVKLDILVHSESVDAFSSIVHRSKAVERGRQMCKSLKEVIPPQLFAVPIQAAIQRNIIARETIRALRKDVTAKCYGGDITRKRKLLERQKEGKKRMKQVGKVSIPQEAFITVLKSTN